MCRSISSVYFLTSARAEIARSSSSQVFDNRGPGFGLAVAFDHGNVTTGVVQLQPKASKPARDTRDNHVVLPSFVCFSIVLIMFCCADLCCP